MLPAFLAIGETAKNKKAFAPHMGQKPCFCDTTQISAKCAHSLTRTILYASRWITGGNPSVSTEMEKSSTGSSRPQKSIRQTIPIPITPSGTLFAFSALGTYLPHRFTDIILVLIIFTFSLICQVKNANFFINPKNALRQGDWSHVAMRQEAFPVDSTFRRRRALSSRSKPSVANTMKI